MAVHYFTGGRHQDPGTREECKFTNTARIEVSTRARECWRCRLLIYVFSLILFFNLSSDVSLSTDVVGAQLSEGDVWQRKICTLRQDGEEHVTPDGVLLWEVRTSVVKSVIKVAILVGTFDVHC
jgi:hypothetical protein